MRLNYKNKSLLCLIALFVTGIPFSIGQNKKEVDSKNQVAVKKTGILSSSENKSTEYPSVQKPLKNLPDTTIKDSVPVIKPDTAVVSQGNGVDSALLDRITALEQQVSDQKPGDDHFMVVGLVTAGFVSNKSINKLNGVRTISKTNSFPDAGRFEFSPMLLWRHGKKFLLEFEPSFNNGGLSVNWADISYFAAPGLIIRAGYFVLPFGFYSKHLAAGWIGKLATDPIGIGFPPGADYGVEVEGGLPLGNMKWSYDLAVTNGLQLLPDGQLQSTGINDNNTNKTFSGRIALLPFSNSSLEIGASTLFGKVGDIASKFENAKATMFAFDLNFVKSINPIAINIKGQYNTGMIDRQNFTNPGDTSQSYSFTNKTTSGYAQISFRPSLVKNDILKNFELAFRYANFTTPSNSLFGQRSNQVDIGLEYWVNWRSVLKFTHEIQTDNSRINQQISQDNGMTRSHAWYLQFSIQL